MTSRLDGCSTSAIIGPCTRDATSADTALDSKSERYIQQSIDALKGRMTVVIIAHRLSTIKNVDYLYVLKGGRIVEAGSFMDLTSNDSSRFREMVELQSL